MAKSKFNFIIILLCITVFACSILSCKDNNSTNSVNQFYLSAPRANNILITNESNIHIGEWSVDNHVIGRRAFRIFPNPFNGPTSIIFSIPETKNVRVWVVRALGPYESSEEFTKWLDAGTMKPDGSPLEVLLDDVLVPGEHYIVWSFKDYPSGFYAVYRSEDGVVFGPSFMLVYEPGEDAFLDSFVKDELGLP